MDDQYATRLGDAYLRVMDAETFVEAAPLFPPQYAEDAARYKERAQFILDLTLVQGGFPPARKGFLFRYGFYVLSRGVWILRYPLGLALVAGAFYLLGIGGIAWVYLALASCLTWMIVQDIRSRRPVA